MAAEARPMQLEDCTARLRREDSLECRWTGARDDAEALRHSLTRSHVAITWLIDGQAAAFAGIVDESAAPYFERRGLVWLLTTDAVRAHPVAFHRLALRFLEACQWDVLHNHVDANYRSALLWLAALGFRVADPQPWGPFGHEFCRVEWRRTWTPSPS